MTRYSIPASRNGLPLNIAGSLTGTAYQAPIGTTRIVSHPILKASGASMPIQIRGSSAPPSAVLNVNRSTPAHAAAVAPHSPLSGIHTLKTQVKPQIRLGRAPGGESPIKTTAKV